MTTRWNTEENAMVAKDGDPGYATIEPYEPVIFDADRARQGRPAWKGEHCGYYLDSEVHPLDPEIPLMDDEIAYINTPDRPQQ